jgi:hypothetical protein
MANIKATQRPGALRRRRRARPACPDIGALMRYRDRVVRVIAEARGQRVMIESVDHNGRRFVSTVKWVSLVLVQDQLF